MFGELEPLGNVQWGFNGSYVERLALNENISVDSAPSWGALPNAYLFGGYGGSAGNWSFDRFETQSGFAPLRIDAGGGNYNYGWVEVTVVSGNTYSPPYLGTVDVTVTGFAFEDQFNTAILAGDQAAPPPCPNPAPGRRRRTLRPCRRRPPAPPPREKSRRLDALLNLASGARGVEKFRADKAA